MHDCLEEVEDERGYRFYLNKTTKVKYKENPSLIMILKKIKSSFIDIKYSSYRSAIKIIQLKKSLYTFCIPFQCAISILKKHKSASSTSNALSPSQLLDVFHDIFYATEKAGFYIEHKNFNLQNAVSIICNFMWNIFDVRRQQNVSLMEMKLTLLILCDLPPANTYLQLIEAHFDIAKDHNNCITRPRFEEFINIFSKILSYLGEPLYFERQTVTEIVNEVFENYPGINGINQFTFTSQFTSHESTKFSSYTNLFLLLIRFKKSEFVYHQNQCSSCHTFPIVGMRFKCQKCKGLSLCFGCFSHGFVNTRHSLGHRMFELSSNEKDHGKLCSFLMNLCNIFRRNPNQNHPEISSVFEHHRSHSDGNSKLIENEHVELMRVDMDGETCTDRGKRRGTIRSEIFNNSENLLIIQRHLMERLLLSIETIKLETESYQQLVNSNRKVFSADVEVEKFLDKHDSFLVEQINQLKGIYDDMTSSQSSSQNSKTIKSSFTSPTTSLFLPHSSTPYRAMKNILKENIPTEPLSMCKSVNGYELNKSNVAENAEYSISDVSTWFQTKVDAKTKDLLDNVASETFETKVTNFRNLLLKVKEIIDDSYSENVDLARTTANLEEVVSKIIDDEEKRRKIQPMK